ncbi:hypothetical protein D3C78_1249330 [compost metagenome]
MAVWTPVVEPRNYVALSARYLTATLLCLKTGISFREVPAPKNANGLGSGVVLYIELCIDTSRVFIGRTA